MLRVSWIFFLGVGALELALMALGKLNLGAGLVVIPFALFFAAVLYGVERMQRDLRAVRDAVEGIPRARTAEGSVPRQADSPHAAP